jgi:hypothetical protein
MSSSTAAPSTPNGDGFSWTPLVVTRERGALLWTQLEEFAAVRQQMGMDTPERFWAAIMEPRNVFLDVGPGFGLVAAMNIRLGEDATVYFLAFDHHLRGKEDAFRGATHYIMRVGNLRRVTAFTPDDMPVTLKLLWRLGFRWEGVLRHGWAWDGQSGDVHVNGLLREECPA